MGEQSGRGQYLHGSGTATQTGKSSREKRVKDKREKENRRRALSYFHFEMKDLEHIIKLAQT